MTRRSVVLTVNGKKNALELAPHRSLLDVLREELGLTGTKKGCNAGDCGACTVLLDDVPINACLVLAVQADGQAVTTIEGVVSTGSFTRCRRPSSSTAQSNAVFVRREFC